MSNENIWHEIDSKVRSLVGQRVFYNHEGTKCLAFVVKAGFERNEAGQIKNKLIVFPPDGAPFNVDAALSSDRRVGSFDIAQPGDLTDSGATPRPPAEVVEELIGETGTNTAPLPTEQPAQSFHPYDKNKDGVVDKQEMKQGRKGQ